jgi:hypothetical protein
MAAAAAQRAENAAAASRPEGLPPEEEIPDAPDDIAEPEGGRE